MSKKHVLEEGQLYAIPLSNGSYTICQLINHHIVSSRTSQDTFAFFYHIFSSIQNIRELEQLNLSDPFSIATSNSKPSIYNWKLLGKANITIKFKYRDSISSLGLFKNRSTDPSVFLEPYFGLFPWDGYFKDDYLDKHLLPNTELRDDVKYLKDFTTDELKKLLPDNSPKLIKRLEEEQL